MTERTMGELEVGSIVTCNIVDDDRAEKVGVAGVRDWEVIDITPTDNGHYLMMLWRVLGDDNKNHTIAVIAPPTESVPSG